MQIIPINIHHLIIALSINQLTIQQISLQRTVYYQNIPSRLLNSSSSIPTLNHSISAAFPFNQHANPPIIHTSAHNLLRMNLDTIQLTIVQKISTTKTSSFKPPTNHAALYLLQITQLVQHFNSNIMQILSQYIRL